MKHVFLEHRPGECPNEGNCMFCDGGLSLCTTCGGAEGTLTTECCGRRITEVEVDQIYKLGTLDFKDGQWVTNESTVEETNSTVDDRERRKELGCSRCPPHRYENRRRAGPNGGQKKIKRWK